MIETIHDQPEKTDPMTSSKNPLERLFESASLGGPENAVGFVLWRIVHRYVREVDRVLAPLELTHLQFTTLILAAWLGRTDSAVTQTKIARFGDVHPMQVSLMLKALEAKALVSRQRTATDVRAKRVEVTAAGVTVLRQALPVVNAVQDYMFGDAGRPGGGVLTALLRIEASLSEKDNCAMSSV